MSDFINTIDVLGDDAVNDSIIQRTITEFNDNKVTRVGDYAFYGCTSLKKADLPNVVFIGAYAFKGCADLEEANFPLATGNLGAEQFNGCESLRSINIPLVTSIGHGIFGSNKALTEVCLPSAKEVGGFRGCSSLWKVDCPVVEKVSGYFSFCGSNLSCLILRNTNMVVPLNGTNGFNYVGEPTPISKGTGYIYVPKALVEDYKVATNWSVYASQFRALEDYTVDGTTTGEIDETKI